MCGAGRAAGALLPVPPGAAQRAPGGGVGGRCLLHYRRTELHGQSNI